MCSNFFFAKKNVSIFSKNFVTKPKLFDVFQLFFSKSKTLLHNPKNFRSERECFGSIMNFVSKTNIFDFFWGRWWENEIKRSLKNVGLTLLVRTRFRIQGGKNGKQKKKKVKKYVVLLCWMFL
jgi:hypothetical protein